MTHVSEAGSPRPASLRAGEASRGLELRDVLDLPFPSDLVAAPKRDRVAWVFNEGGRRNVWLASVGGDSQEAAKALTRYCGDDGIVIGHLRWNMTGDAVVYARGMVLSDDPPPNPASATHAPVGPDLWLVNLHDAAVPRRLGSGHSAEPSPVHGDIAWIHAGQVWKGSERADEQAAVLFRDRGRCRDLCWSPDGTRLAFVSERGEHSLIGIYDMSTRTIRWMAPGVYRDTSPTWSPDGRQIAFIRLADSAAETYTAKREGPPWSVWTSDAETGLGRCVWRAPKGAGSVFRPLAIGPQLIWTAEGEIVFPWEGCGWLHLHRVNPGSTESVDLTPGPYEVASMAANPHGDSLICAANKNELEGCRLWCIELRTRELSPLTSERALTWAPVLTDGGQVVALQADARTPLHPVWLERTGAARALAAEVFPADFPYPSLVDPQQVAFHSPDGQKIHAQLFLPADGGDTSARPAIVHFHGGPMRQMFAAWHPTECYHLQYGLNQYLANCGYVVMSVNYRGGTGYGLEFREALGLGPAGASEYQDAIGAALYLGTRGDVDAERIGVYGVSYGGLMTALALGRASDLFAAGVDCAGISNWRPAFTGAAPEVLERATASSPLSTADAWKSPVLFIHGDDDRTVPFNQTVEIVRTLDQRDGVDVGCIVLPDEQHDFLRRASWACMFDATTDFFQRTIGPASA